MIELTIDHNDANQRLDKFLAKTFPKLPKSMMYKAIRTKKIKVNRKRASLDQQLREQDRLQIFLPPDLLEKKEAIDLGYLAPDIVYEDENLLVLNKPRGLLCQPSQTGHQDCLANRLLAYASQYASQSYRPALVNRLDRNTQGLVLASKNALSHRILSDAIAHHHIRKWYKAKVEGQLRLGSYTFYLKKEGTKAHVQQEAFAGAKKCKMDVLSQEGSTAIIELKTGRFHQIRAGLAYFGHPLVGDIKYGSKVKTPYYLEAYQLDLTQVDLPLKERRFHL